MSISSDFLSWQPRSVAVVFDWLFLNQDKDGCREVDECENSAVHSVSSRSSGSASFVVYTRRPRSFSTSLSSSRKQCFIWTLYLDISMMMMMMIGSRASMKTARSLALSVVGFPAAFLPLSTGGLAHSSLHCREPRNDVLSTPRLTSL